MPMPEGSFGDRFRFEPCPEIVQAPCLFGGDKRKEVGVLPFQALGEPARDRPLRPLSAGSPGSGWSSVSSVRFVLAWARMAGDGLEFLRRNGG